MYGDCHKGEVDQRLVTITWLLKSWGKPVRVTDVNDVAEKPTLSLASPGCVSGSRAGTSRPQPCGTRSRNARPYRWSWAGFKISSGRFAIGCRLSIGLCSGI